MLGWILSAVVTDEILKYAEKNLFKHKQENSLTTGVYSKTFCSRL